MKRNWSDLENDEIRALWQSYLSYEESHNDMLRTREPVVFRLTFTEIIKLVKELLIRLR